MSSKETVKKANELVEYTPDTISKLKKCSEDPTYFIENYCKIEHPTKGIIDFKLYDYQKEIINAFKNNRFTLLEISRQTGKCITKDTKIEIYHKPKGIKKLMLNLFFRNIYNEIFKN